MGVFTRMRDIVNSNINAMLEKAEDPEKLVKLMIQEMDDTLVEIKAGCAGAMATCKKVERDLREARGHVDRWEANARAAVNKGREDLAREALVEKRTAHERAEALARELADCESVVEQYRKDIDQLEDKRATAEQKYRSLVERHRHAHRQKAARTQVRRAGSADAFARFAAFENRIERLEAEASLVTPPKRKDLEGEIAHLAEDEQINAELERIKTGASPTRGAPPA